MNKLFLLILITFLFGQASNENNVIARQGRVAFFSYTSVENIKAVNNQVSSIIDLSTGEVAVSMLMNSFVFEKALMHEHFNESYIESDIYPKANFEGIIIDFEAAVEGEQTRMIKGTFAMHGEIKELEFKAKITHTNGRYVVSGSFDTYVSDYNIKIPALLAGNIAKTIKVDFTFEYEPYES